MGAGTSAGAGPVKPFLTAEWRRLAIINYEIDARLVSRFVPHGTELDSWNGRTYVSLVGFRFLNTRVLGVTVPFHSNFEEVNLRFYVRHKAEDGWRRGVVFIKEIVPRRAIATVARRLYNENYVTMPMGHEVNDDAVRYEWWHHGERNWLRARFSGISAPATPGSEEEFITEHYWGYSKQRDRGTVEYRVEHPSWLVWHATEVEVKCGVAAIYGEPFVHSLAARPTSAFIADGSAVTVFRGVRL